MVFGASVMSVVRLEMCDKDSRVQARSALTALLNREDLLRHQAVRGTVDVGGGGGGRLDEAEDLALVVVGPVAQVAHVVVAR